MKAVVINNFGDSSQLSWSETETPRPKAHEILVEVKAAGVNRADIVQRQGNYPPPQGASELLGLEIAGVVKGLGEKVTSWKQGDAVMGLIPGGGYAAYAVIHEDMAMPIPSGLSFTQAAGIPEAFLTAFQALKWIGKLHQGDKVLIHAGASGVGSAAIQLAKAFQAGPVFITASAGKHAYCQNLGADHTIDYKTENFREVIAAKTQEQGVNVIVDFMGAAYFQDNLKSLATDGRLVLLALMGGSKVPDVALARVLLKRLTIAGSTLRSRPVDYQIQLTRDFVKQCWPLFEPGALQPNIDKAFPMHMARQAHDYMEGNKNKGKIILENDGAAG